MKLKDFHYTLPEELIAQTPLKHRGDSRLLVMDRSTGELEDTEFERLDAYLRTGDVLVLNDTEVLPARLFGVKEKTGALIEILLLNQFEGNCWACLVKKARKISVGTIVSFGGGRLKAVCTEVKDAGICHFEMHYEGVFYALLDELGEMPLPPYIHEKLEDKNRYQTVYSKHIGSAAAPTAGLHFTTSHLERLESRGIEIVYITLHVGLGTFRPVSVQDVKTHKMHEEYYSVSETAAAAVNRAKAEHRRVIAVGTTSLRTLETVATQGRISAKTGLSDLFIYPGFTFQITEALLTNFHLPQSTLLMLVSAFSSRKMILETYAHAVQMRYRFFSFGDAMFLTDMKVV